MKSTIIFLILFFAQLVSYAQTDKLNGTIWKLQSIDIIESGKIVFAKKHYSISFKDGYCRYSLEKNSCGGPYEILNKEYIFIGNGPCTRVCCDGDISNLISYRGKVKIRFQNHKLILTTNSKIYTFIKSYGSQSR